MENPMTKYLNSRCFNQVTRKEGVITGVPERATSTACFVEVTYDDGTTDIAAFGWLKVLDRAFEVKFLYRPMSRSVMAEILRRRVNADDPNYHA